LNFEIALCRKFLVGNECKLAVFFIGKIFHLFFYKNVTLKKIEGHCRREGGDPLPPLPPLNTPLKSVMTLASTVAKRSTSYYESKNKNKQKKPQKY
jgi:hypothetical protein